MTTVISTVDEVKGTLVKMQPQFELALPKHISPEKFVKVAETAIMNNPALLQLDRQSLYIAFTQAAQDGLLPDGREAAIIPFSGKAKYVPMVAGVCKKVRNSGEISVVDAKDVYANDEYDYYADEKGEHFRFKPARGERGDYLLTFAYAIGKDGGVFFEEITAEQMEAIKKQALSKLPIEKQKNSPWMGPFEGEMRRKSGLRRLGKYRLPNSSDLDLMFKRDDELYEEEEAPKDITPKTTPTNLALTIEAQASPTVEQAVTAAQEIFPEAKVVSQRPAKVQSPPVAQGVTISGLELEGTISTMTAKPAKNGSIRHAVKIGENWYGTFDTNIGKQLIEAADNKYKVKIKYQQKKTAEGKAYNDITEVILPGLETEEGIPL